MKKSRRQFVTDTFKVTLLTTLGVSGLSTACSTASKSDETDEKASSEAPSLLKFAQVPLPYAYDALEPNIDAMTMDIHYNKHHAGYVKNINAAIADEKITYSTPEELFMNSSKISTKAVNNSGGAWNHNFFWESMKPGSAAPSSKVTDALQGAFGGIDQFKEKFAAAAMGRFGSGWAWLISKDGKLEIGSTPNQINPLMDLSDLKGKPVLALDVWEHAYYLKYQNKRNEYVANWWNVVNWEKVASLI